MAREGDIIEKRYLIRHKIGQGGMSSVYLAYDTNLGKEWAIKEIPKNEQDFIVSSALAEVNLMKKLDHPSLPSIVDIINDRKYIYVVMDYIKGETLGEYIERNGTANQKDVIKWAKELCDVLDYLHSQEPPIIYRDMKPDNIMLMQNGKIKLIDFGIAREYKNQNVKDTICLGTRGYAAPEQFGGKGQTDQRTDIYCLGVTLYHLITGKNPCEAPYKLYPIRHWNPSLSPGLENIIMKCTEPLPEDRYEDCKALRYSLDNYVKQDKEYIRKRKRQIAIYRGFAISAVFCFVMGIITGSIESKVRIGTYMDYLAKSESALTVEDKVSCVIDAINEKPDEIGGYEKLISIYSDDDIFSVVEEKQLCEIMATNRSLLMKDAGYRRLAYEIGILYWYYYYCGTKYTDEESERTRIKSSMNWFKDACEGEDINEFTGKAEIYYLMATFSENVTMNIGGKNENRKENGKEDGKENGKENGKEKGMYLAYFENLKALFSLCKQDFDKAKEDESEAVKQDESEKVSHARFAFDTDNYQQEMKAVKMILNSLDTYYYQFVKDGVSENDIKSFGAWILEETATWKDKEGASHSMDINEESALLQEIIELGAKIEKKS